VARLIPIKARPDLHQERPVIELTGKGKLLCYEKCGGRWFRSSYWHVEDDLAIFQELYETEEYVSLADLHDNLGITSIMKDHDFGWNTGLHGAIMIISITLMEGGYMGMEEPVLLLEPNALPERNFTDF